MTQRIFDRENEKDMADLWDILPDWVYKVVLEKIECFDKPRVVALSEDGVYHLVSDLIAIDWHDKTEITRPIQECTEQDIGKICVFYDNFDETDDEPDVYAVLHKIENQGKNTWFYTDTGSYYAHCRRLTKQEIEELI